MLNADTLNAIASIAPLMAILVSFAAVPLILMSGKHPNLREFWTLAAAVAKFLLVLTLLPGALADQIVELHILELAPGIDLTLRADPLGVFFALIASGLWILTSFYSIGYVRGNHEHRQTRYFASFAMCVSATIGIAFSANLLTFLLFFEILTVATYPLVIHKETAEARSGGRKYLAYTLTAGNALIIASAWTYHLAGTLDFQAGGLLQNAGVSPVVGTALFLLFFVGVGVKAGIMPFHSWLPAAMVAPTPVSALLHAVAVVKSGVFGMYRVVGFVFGPELMGQLALNEILFVLAGITIIVSSLLALRQDNLKKRLAYSTVGHLSYIILGAALLSPSGFAGGLMHIASHAVMKITLFFCAGAIYVNVHKENISDLDGLGKAMPWTMGAFAIGAFGLAGIPPIFGFTSKFLLGAGTLEAGQWVGLFILLTSGILNVAYFFPIIHRVFFRKSDQFAKYGEASPLMLVPILITATLSVVFGLLPNLWFHFYDLAQTITNSVLGGPPL
jgi:multicomponent Na+:H+ antiporter subunit D